MDFKHTSIKQSALGWVKKSIDDNLAAVRRELNIFIEEKDASVLSSVQEKLSAVKGVLSMIEQYGAAMLTEEMGSLCEYIAGKEQQDQQALEVLLRSVLQLPDYLEHIQVGQIDIPIAILPLLNDIRAAKNEDLFSDKLLFLPDLSMHNDDSEYDAIDENRNQHSRQLAKKLRPVYQLSILGLMRDKDIDSNLGRIGKITEVMEERSSSEQVARLWWIIGALIESVSRDNLPLGASVKMLLGKADQIFRNMMLKGERELIRVQPIELIKNLLYYIAQPECDGPKSLAIKTAYRLEQFLPSSGDQAASNIAGPNQELLKTVSDAVKADIEEVKSTLEVYVNGDINNTQLLESIPGELHIISDTLAMIGLGSQRQLIESQITMITSVVEGKKEPESEKLLAMAAELIQVDQALELMQKGQFYQQGEEITSTSASINFEMDNMLSAVVTAALDDIQKIKDAILDFIKDSTKEENIQFCKTLLQETRGALDLLSEARAVSIIEGLIQYLDNHDLVDFMQSNRLDQLSQVVVSIEYYLEAVGEQRLDADSILDFADAQLELLLEDGIQKEALIEAEYENLLIDDTENVEAEKASSPGIELQDDVLEPDEITGIDIPVVDQQKSKQLEEEGIDDVVNDINTDLEEIQDALKTEAISGAVDGSPKLEAESEFAEAEIDEVEIELTSEDALDAQQEISPEIEQFAEAEVELELESEQEAEPKLEIELEEGLESETDEATTDEIDVVPVDEDLPVLKPGSDPEILEIYLEEAEEESGNIMQLQQDWRLHPEDENALKNIRRAFHTIKGSGRLVGAMKIGEFAWDFESLLNLVIDKAVAPTEQVIDAVGLSAKALPELVEELKNGTPVTADIPYIRGLARALAEFKAGQVLAVRKDSKKITESVPERIESLQIESLEENSPRIETKTKIEPEPLAIDEVTAESNNQIEETPPDPFVSSEMVGMPGGEVGLPLPDEQTGEQEPSEITDLQIDPELLIIYQQEVESHLSIADSVLEQQPAADGGLKPTEELYRAIHTINGASRTADITSIAQLATLLENPLKIILEQGAAFDADVLDLYRRGHDAIHQMTLDLVKNRQIPELSETLKLDLESLVEQLDAHTVEMPELDDQSTSQFIDTLTMMNEPVESVEADYDDELVEIFIDEAIELLDMSDHTLQTWSEQDDSTDDGADFGLVMELQRYLHTLKGGAKMAEFNDISDLGHELESLFIAVIDARIEKTDDLIDTLHDSFDLLSTQVDQAKNHQPLDSSRNQINLLQQLRVGESGEQKEKTEQQQVKSEVLSVEQTESGFKESNERLAKDEANKDRRKNDRDVVKVRSELLDNLVSSAGEVSIYRARMEQQVSSFGANLSELGQTITRLKNQLRALEAETDAQIHFSHKNDADETQGFDPLEMDRYTQIQELSKSLSESVDDLSSLQSILGDQVKDSETLLLQQSRINTDLQDGLIRSRMVRFSGLASRLRRLVRKTCSELAKKAELVIEGDQHEVDIKVLDRMLPPIEHILRNSISHGIESPIERVNKGKSEAGQILIKVSRDGSDIVLKISDDGAGINVRKVRARAVELGLLGEREKMDDNDVVQFILEPGFSTAEQVSQVAGRGVGMDVVDSSIKQLGGALQIATSSQGTELTARLPFTLSINQAILVQAAEESFALPLINIEGITRIESDQMFDIYQQEKPALDYAGQQYSLYYLSSLLDTSKKFQVIDDALKVPVILLRSGDLRIALHIDELLGNREIVVKPLGKLLSQVKGLSGASILADGMVVLILDIKGLIRHGLTTHSISEHPVEVKQQKQQPGKLVKKVVMVVDDSITMRRVATKLLNRNNYEVVTAKDGVDALAQLQDVNPDVMLLDIEMPRMDGFELAIHMRNEDSYRDIPIIMITSRTGNKHRDHAMKIGVEKYMGKPYQEEELIENISALVEKP